MNTLTLYTNPQSRGQIAHWMLEELEIPYETVWLDFATTMKTPEYLAINPMGKVPALTHGERVITEAAAICAYLADAFPEKNLIPAADSIERAPYFRWLFFAAGPLEQAITANSQGWKVPSTPEAEGQLGFGSYARALNALETALTGRDYVCGTQFTAADVYLGLNVAWCMHFGILEKRPAFVAYAQRVSERPAKKRLDAIIEQQTKAGQ